MSTSTSLLQQASAVLEESTPNSNRAACWIARAALENAIDDLLEMKGRSAPGATMRSKLTLLQVAFGREDELPARAEYVWSRLSQTCHHHAFELAPTAIEVRHLIQLARTLVNEASAVSVEPTFATGETATMPARTSDKS